jgi:hypothetical protein
MYYAKTISHASTFYHYRKERDGALTNSRFEGVYYSDRIKACNILDEFLKSNGDKTQYGLLFVEKQKLKDYLLTTNDYKKWKELFPDVAKWNFKKSDANIVYRLFYLLGGTVSYRFIELYTKLSGLISSRNKQ